VDRQNLGHHGGNRFLLRVPVESVDTLWRPRCARMWQESVASINKYLADRSLWLVVWAGGDDYRSAHHHQLWRARCVLSAVLALAGDVDRAAVLQDSSNRCGTWRGLSRRQLDYRAMKIVRPDTRCGRRSSSQPTTSTTTRTMRSILPWADLLQFPGEYCRTDVGYAALADVRSKKKTDSMESFFFAETLKYLYLLYAPESTLDFDTIVFNTEAHPMYGVWGGSRRGCNSGGPCRWEPRGLNRRDGCGKSGDAAPGVEGGGLVVCDAAKRSTLNQNCSLLFMNEWPASGYSLTS